jgi:CheY-like chemotaxis protein
MNLAVNARDAMPGAGTLSIQTRNTEFHQDLVCDGAAPPAGHYVLLSVSDTGSGMDEATKAHIFEPFFTTKAEGKGTGLGLASVHDAVAQLGGHIFVESAPGAGTIFKIYLPAVQEEIEPAVPEETATQLVGGSETILLVEDAMTLREIISEELQALGYQVLAAASSEEAIEAVRQYGTPVHLLLTDIVMPRMSGPELATRVAALHPETRVLYMSGYDSDKLAGFPAGDPGAAFIHKPFAVRSLADKLREVLA